MGVLSREEIDGADDIAYETVKVPEWKTKDGKPGEIRIRGCTMQEREEYADMLDPDPTSDKKARVLYRQARLCVKCIVDDAGKRLYKDNEAALLAKKSAGVIDRIFGRILDLSGLTEKSRKAIEKNSDASQTEDSSSS
jgi:hypothetical protein